MAKWSGAILFVFILCKVIMVCSHGIGESPHYKYSSEANSPMDQDDEVYHHHHGDEADYHDDEAHYHGDEAHDDSDAAHEPEYFHEWQEDYFGDTEEIVEPVGPSLTKAQVADQHSHKSAHDHSADARIHKKGDSKLNSRSASAAFQRAKGNKDSFDHAHTSRQQKGLGKAQLWIQSLLATLLISATPVVILFFIPLDHTDRHHKFLKVLLAFAAGGLLGDAFLHLIPHAVIASSENFRASSGLSPKHARQTSHGHSHGAPHEESANMFVSLWVLVGIVAFLCVEKIVRHVKGGSGHSHTTSVIQRKNDEKKEETASIDGKKTAKSTKEGGKEASKDSGKGKDPSTGSGLHVSGWLNLAADMAHNFTDGLAIGASFCAGQNIGIITTATVLLHEVPHEIGDFAILLRSGCTKKQAMGLQFLTAIGAVLGTLVSLIAEGSVGGAATLWVLPFTAGGFIYIASVTVLPELLEERGTFSQSFKEILALLTGVFMMVVIGWLE